SCGNGAHIGYNCPPKALIISNLEQCNQTINEFLQILPSVHPTYNSGDENSFTYDSKPNFADDSPNVFNPPPQPSMYSCEFCGNDARYGHYCTPQVPSIYPEPCYNQGFNFPLFNSQNEFLNSQNKLIEQMTSMCDMNSRLLRDDATKKSSIPLKDIISELPPYVAITPDSPKMNSLIMEDEHLDTIPETESDELIKSSVESLVQIPSEFEDSSEGECDLPPYDDSSKNHDLTFFNPLFDINEDFTSKITSTKVDQIDDEVLENTNSIPPGIEYLCFNAESDLLESLLHRDTSINDSQKIDSLLDEFTGELTLPHSIPPGIDDVNLDPEGDILFLESLLYDNSSPRPPEEFNSENPTESFSPSPIPVEDSDSLMEEIDIFLDGDDSIPPGIESDDFDSEDDDNSTSRPEFESFHVDYPDSGDSTIDVVEDIPVDVPNILPTHPALQLDFNFIPSNDLGSDLDVSSPSGDSNKIYDPGICIEVESTRFLSTLSPVIDTLLTFSSENEDKVFNHGVLASKEKSPSSLSHRGFF
ncbi:hypothetical protein Tco_0333335, partial [Tanacetum coccineum]